MSPIELARWGVRGCAILYFDMLTLAKRIIRLDFCM